MALYSNVLVILIKQFYLIFCTQLESFEIILSLRNIKVLTVKTNRSFDIRDRSICITVVTVYCMWHLLKSGNFVLLNGTVVRVFACSRSLRRAFHFCNYINHTCSPSLFFSHFPALHFWSSILQSRIFHPPAFLTAFVPQIPVSHFQRPRQNYFLHHNV